MNCYRLSLISYSAFLEYSGFYTNKLAAGFVAYEGNSIKNDLNEAVENSLIDNSEVTSEGKLIAQIISSPDKTIVATNSSFGLVPLCVFSCKDGVWVLVSFDHKSKMVTIFAPIEKSNITSIAIDALIGDIKITNYSPFTITLSNDEADIYSMVLMLLGNRAKEKNAALMPSDCRFCFQDLIFGKEFATLALAEDVLSSSSNILSLVNDPERCRLAINGLIGKKILVKSPLSGYLQPDIAMFYKLAPQKGMFILSYNDLATSVGHKYYVYRDSLLEVYSDGNSITFTSKPEIDCSVWN